MFGAATALVDITREPANTGRSLGQTPSPNPSTLRPAKSSPPSKLTGNTLKKPGDDNAFVSSHETVQRNLGSYQNSPPVPPVPLLDPAVGGDKHGDGPTSECLRSLPSWPIFMRIPVHQKKTLKTREKKKADRRLCRRVRVDTSVSFTF